ncbi:MAG: histidinol-phosphate transaminase [Candidatus Wallbacteria bacterium]|nr:histidinol-phosphate transaminase [Candidatus Wallbacteria bacterium]
MKYRKHLEKFEPYMLPKSSGEGVLKLNLNESRWGCSPGVLEVLKNARSQDVCEYPQYDKLVNRIASLRGVSPDRIIVGNGEDDLIHCLAETFLEPGDTVVHASPTYPMFPIMSRMKQACVVEVPYGQDLGFPLEKMISVVRDGARMAVIVNPANPTGGSLGRESIVSVFEACRKDTVLVLDEAYFHFAGVSHLDLTEKFPNLIVLNTFSKAYGLAGMRLGYAVSSQANICEMQKTILPITVNSMAVSAGIAAIDDEPFLSRVVRETLTEKKILISELSSFGIRALDTDTNFLLVEFGPAADKVHQGLKDEGVLVRDVGKWSQLKGFLRITVGLREDSERLIAALKKIV